MAGELSGARRLKSAVLSRSMITLDVDYADSLFPVEFDTRFPGVAAVIYNTRSDREKSRRFRVVIPFAEEVQDAAQYEAAARKMAELLGIDLFDPTTFQAERMMYWQSLSSDQPKVFEVFEGEPISAEYLLSLYGNNEEWRDIRNWAFKSDQEKETRAIVSKAMAQNPREKAGLVGAFCRAYSVPAAIEKYLSDVYEIAPGNDRYTYKAGHSVGGMIVFDDLFCFSYHSTDPISDGHAYNAYDLVRVHKFGHLGKEDSTKEMNKLVCADKECVKDMVTPDADLDDFDDYGDAVKSDSTEEVTELVWDLDGKGNKLVTVNNFVNAFKSDPLLNGLLAYDMLKETIVFTRPSFTAKGSKKGDLVNDTDISIIKGRIERMHGIYNDAKLNDAIEQVSSDNAFHPIKLYLESLTWDGVPRIDTFLVDYMGAEDNAYTREAFRKMLLAAVTRIYEPGRKFDTALVFYSEQGVGKSTLIQRLSKGWFNDSLTNLSGKESYEAIRFAWLVELAELSALRKSDVEAVKNFISKREDTYRGAYARRVKTHKRQCVFFGSTNDDEFLKDATGNRRFFPVSVKRTRKTRIIFEPEFDAIVDQLWAEAMEGYMLGEALTLSDEAEAIAGGTREEFTERTPIQGLIEEYLDRLFPADYEDRFLAQRLDFLNGDLGEEGTEAKNSFSLIELWTEALGRRKDEYTVVKARELSNAVKALKGWKRDKQARQKIYGPQVIYRRVGAGITK
nr:MAG: virulence-associated protein E [Bacteriophage sp.]